MNVEQKAFVKNAADKEQVKAAERKSKWKREDEIADMKQLLEEPAFRRFIWRYLTDCNMFQTSFTGNSQTFFLEGQRNVGLKIMADINDANPEAYLTMIRESKKGEH